MSIARRAASSLATGTTSVTISQPAGTSNGDVLVALVVDKATSGSSVAPTGWTRKGGAADSSGRLQVFTAVVGQGGLTGTSWNFAGLTTTASGVIVGYTGVHNATPIDVAPSARVNASGTTGTTSITTVKANSLVLAAFASLANGATWSSEAVATSPTLTEFFDSANGSSQSIALADGAKATAGATGVSSAAMSSNAANAGVLIALRADPAVSEKVSKTVVHSTVSQARLGANVTKSATFSVLSRPGSGDGQSTSKTVSYGVVSTEDRTKVSKALTCAVLEILPQFVSKAITYAVAAPNDLQKVSKSLAYAVVLAAIGPSYPQKASKVTAYAAVLPVLGTPQWVSKTLGYSVLDTFGLQVPKVLAYTTLEPRQGSNSSKLNTYALVEPPGGANVSKSLAYAVVKRPIPILQQKKLAQAFDFASMTWDQQSRLLQYEMIRTDGLDQPGPAWQPPRTLTLRCWQVVPFTPSEGSARVSKAGASVVLASRSLSVSKAATYALIAPRSLWVPKAMCYSVLSTYLPGICLSKCVAEVVCVPFAALFVVKALAYAVVY